MEVGVRVGVGYETTFVVDVGASVDVADEYCAPGAASTGASTAR